MNPNFRESTNQVWRQTVHRQPGTATGAHATREAVVEKIRREVEPVPVEEVKQHFANPRSPSSPPWPDNPATSVYDRLHKWWTFNVFVANKHFAGEDPIGEPAAYHSIVEGYAFAKNTLVPKLIAAYGPDTNYRVKITVLAGYYTETVIMTSPYIDIVGVSRPVIFGRVLYSSDAENALFDGFKVINDDTPEDDEYRDYSGLYIDVGNESGTHFSDIQIKRCWFEGPNMQVHSRRWADFFDCDFVSTNNLTNGAPSVQVAFVPSDDFAPQSKWTQFRNCRFNGMPFPGGIDAPTYFRKGYALEVTCIDPDTGDWTPNALTRSSGVLLEQCRISGWSRNYGWNFINDYCRHIEGDMLNATSGSIHHYCVSNSDIPADANSWFNHPTYNVRYPACIIDVGAIPGTANSNVYLHHIKRGGADHANPPILAGSDVIDGGNLLPPQGIPAGAVFISDYSTPAPFGYGGPVELSTNTNFTPNAPLPIFTDFFEDT